MRRIVLASSSPRRQEVLRAAGFEFDAVPATGAEDARAANETPAAYAERLARQKAEAVAKRLPAKDDRVVLGADTIVVADGEVLGKPASPEDARAMLRRLSGRAHAVVTGVALAEAGRARRVQAHETTQVFFRPLTEQEIQAYVSTGEPLDKAGAYAVQGRAARFVTRVEGCYFNVVGLPVALVDRLLRDWERRSGSS
ncbi:MAG: Maf family protein [Terriglobia bacterium]